jgi:hypothetical protein
LFKIFIEAISKIVFWFKFAAGTRFPAARDSPSDFIPLRVKTGGILPYFEDLKRGTNKEIDPPLAGWAKRHF